MLGGVTRLLLTLTVLGVAGHDAAVLGIGRFSAQDDAGLAARAAALTYRDSGSPQQAYESALTEVADERGRIAPTDFTVDATGAVTLTLRTEVRTLVSHRLGPLRQWGVLATTATAGRPR